MVYVYGKTPHLKVSRRFGVEKLKDFFSANQIGTKFNLISIQKNIKLFMAIVC